MGIFRRSEPKVYPIGWVGSLVVFALLGLLIFPVIWPAVEILVGWIWVAVKS